MWVYLPGESLIFLGGMLAGAALVAYAWIMSGPPVPDWGRRTPKPPDLPVGPAFWPNKAE